MSHPTYDKYGKYAGTIEERMVKSNLPDAWSQEGLKLREEFAAKHGRSWQVFDFYQQRHGKNKKPWIEQFR